jgi:hypothetical protein
LKKLNNTESYQLYNFEEISMSIIKKILHPFIILIIVGILNLILGVIPQIIDDEQEVEEVLLLMT